ncbi:MAG: thiamine-phosphate kinase [Betaproteobacteria bacterium]
MNEFELIDRFFTRPPRAASVHLGVGDDAALLAPTPGCELVASVDMLVSGRHFLADADPEKLGRKTLAVNLSDMAAMGATPKWALLAGALPDNDPAWLAAFAHGFFAVADRFGVDLVGGDTTRGPLNLCVTILGEVPSGRALQRSGAAPGDDVYVSGTLGDAALAVAAMAGRTTLDESARAACRARLDTPTPRIALGEALRGVASAALDISDGLTGDLGHILERSRAGATIDLAAIPRSAVMTAKLAGADRVLAQECLLAGGDDYELCFTAPPPLRPRISAIAHALDLPLTRIGAITAEPGLVVRDGHGAPLPVLPRAYDHFGGSGR